MESWDSGKKRKADESDAPEAVRLHADLEKMTAKQLKRFIAEAKKELDRKMGWYLMVYLFTNTEEDYCENSDCCGYEDDRNMYVNYVLYMKFIEEEGPKKEAQGRLVDALLGLEFEGKWSELVVDHRPNNSYSEVESWWRGMNHSPNERPVSTIGSRNISPSGSELLCR